MAVTTPQEVHTNPGAWSRLLIAASRPLDGSSLAVFRIGFGLMVAWEGARYLDRGWVDAYYADASYTFTYWPFDWVQPLPGGWLPVPWMAMTVAGLLVAMGAWYRPAAVVAWLSLSYAVLLDKTQYLNHLYLAALITFLLIWVPANREWALQPPRRAPRTVPAWSVAIIAFQVAVPYFFAGVAKLNGDWLRGRPIDDWLAESTGVPGLGRLFGLDHSGVVAAWGSLAFDLTVAFLLLRRRTRPWAFLVLLLFHMTNARVFSIGIFPWTMILASTILLPPSWPRAFVRTVREGSRPDRIVIAVAGAVGALVGLTWYRSIVPTHVLVGAFGAALTAWLFLDSSLESFRPLAAWRRLRDDPGAATSDPPPSRGTKVLVGAAIVWVVVQLLVPLRHLVVPGNVHWNEAGHRFAWHMKLRDKPADLALRWRPAGKGAFVEVDLDDYLLARQIRVMEGRPDMIVQFAHHLEDLAGEDIEVYANSTASLNGRSVQVFVEPDVDLTEVSRSYIEPRFVAPLEDE